MIRRKKTKIEIARDAADAVWKIVVKAVYGDLCEVCQKPAGPPHHFFPKGNYGHMRYNVKNGVPLCVGCHFRHHHTFDPSIHQAIVQKRGKAWYNKLLEESKNRKANYRNVGWFEENKKRLTAKLSRIKKHAR